MAKLKAPLLSLGASGQIGKALVFFPWKGLNVAREYIIPSNPKTSGQTTQRGYLAAAVLDIHQAQGTTPPMDATDVQAYSLLASTIQAASTWFNTLVKQLVDMAVAGLDAIVWRSSTITPGANSIDFELLCTHGSPTAVTCKYGTSKTALVSSKAAAEAPAGTWTAEIVGLTDGVKYYFQMRPTAPAGLVGGNSGIYYGVAGA